MPRFFLPRHSALEAQGHYGAFADFNRAVERLHFVASGACVAEEAFSSFEEGDLENGSATQ